MSALGRRPTAFDQLAHGTDHVSGRAIRGTVTRFHNAGVYLLCGDGVVRYSEDARRVQA